MQLTGENIFVFKINIGSDPTVAPLLDRHPVAGPWFESHHGHIQPGSVGSRDGRAVYNNVLLHLDDLNVIKVKGRIVIHQPPGMDSRVGRSTLIDFER